MAEEPIRPTRLELKIEHDDATQIEGSLSVAGGQPVSFTGWLELMSLIDQIGGHNQEEQYEEEHR